MFKNTYSLNWPSLTNWRYFISSIIVWFSIKRLIYNVFRFCSIILKIISHYSTLNSLYFLAYYYYSANTVYILLSNQINLLSNWFGWVTSWPLLWKDAFFVYEGFERGWSFRVLWSSHLFMRIDRFYSYNGGRSGKERFLVEQCQAMGVHLPTYRQKQYFNVAHTIDLGINDDSSNKVTIFGN